MAYTVHTHRPSRSLLGQLTLYCCSPFSKLATSDRRPNLDLQAACPAGFTNQWTQVTMKTLLLHTDGCQPSCVIIFFSLPSECLSTKPFMRPSFQCSSRTAIQSIDRCARKNCSKWGYYHLARPGQDVYRLLVQVSHSVQAFIRCSILLPPQPPCFIECFTFTRLKHWSYNLNVAWISF